MNVLRWKETMLNNEVEFHEETVFFLVTNELQTHTLWVILCNLLNLHS